MPTFAEILAKRAKERTERKPEQDEDRVLFGSGITKKTSEQAQRAVDKTAQKDWKAQSEEVDAARATLLHIDIPSNLMTEGLELDADQRHAVSELAKLPFGCLIGSAGTGKTTTEKALVRAIERDIGLIDVNSARLDSQKTNKEELNIAACFVSFTGRAVQQMKRALPKEYHALCGTIHSTLGYAPVEEEYLDSETNEWQVRKVFRPTFTATNKLPYKLCFMDESGMCPIYLFNELIAALPDDCRVILIGDINQLPPVHGRSVLGFAMSAWPTFELRHVHRQAADNPIIANAQRVLKGLMPVADPKHFQIITCEGGSSEVLLKAQAIVRKLHGSGMFEPLRDAFIVPQNVGPIGQIEFNARLVRYFNPTVKVDNVPINPPVLITGGFEHYSYAIGDVIMIKNNEKTLGLTNGMLGIIREIAPNPHFKGAQIADQIMTGLVDNDDMDMSDLGTLMDDEVNADKDKDKRERQASHIVRIEFQDNKQWVDMSSAGALGKIGHAYTITCHKSQGGEYPTVIVLAHSANLKMLTREWLYTAITRAKERVILITNYRGLQHALRNQAIKGNSLQEKAAAFLALSEMSDDEVDKPNLMLERLQK